ncbi:DUF3426 domain-containing protein [Lysobacter sp. LF1]|uniref:DUF3426 domain-containing protein n=1 Tax=Lysobacter stagni TaxID=3045172 RepID=A0ABT6XBU4_9GAMM|nr:DUF3426 domain-containing protein [Lysobacter sp. LF1]MDI9237610.1 DUF3426 domain-containing protein [Lysobacter sp. LF1]
MFVSCPHCGFLVALIVREDDQPQRCPRCDGIVQATPGDASSSADDVPADTAPMEMAEDAAAADADADASAPGSVTDETTADNADEASAVPDVEAIPDTAAPSYEEAIAAATAGSAPPRARRGARPRRKGGPSFARHTVAPAPRRTSWRAIAAIAALTLLLALQLLLAQRQELAADPRWRPFVAGMCGVLRCQLPPWREPAAFTMLQRSVRPKPGDAGVLSIEASFRNDARWAQPWPVLMLSLSDVDGRQVGLRAFEPGEYRREHHPGDELLPGQSATVSMDVIEPAPRIVAFTFDFR